MPEVMNQDDIDKIAEYKEKDYSNSAIARELGIDRTTVRKYSPKEQEPEKGKEGGEPKHELSLEEDFDLRTKKKEIELELENLRFKLEDTDGETHDLGARREVALEQIKILREKLDEIESVMDIDKVRELAAKVKDEVTALLEQIEPLRKQREEQQEKERQEREEKERKKRQEDWARSDKIGQNLRAGSLSRFAWIFPCSREQAEKIVNKFIWKVDTLIAEEKQRIVNIMHARKERILNPSDEDMRKKFVDLLSAETNEKFVKMALKFNAALGRLAEQRFIKKEELLSKETPERLLVSTPHKR